MSLFKKTDRFDISCRDRSIKNRIDEYYGDNPIGEADYQDRVAWFVEQGIKYRQLLSAIITEAYSMHKSDSTCDIPDYKTFLSLERTMLENKDAYRDKTICVEGFVFHVFNPFYPDSWERDTAGVEIYPLPCRTDLQKKVCVELVDNLCAIESVTLVSDTPIRVENGVHIRVHGVPYFYNPFDGGKPAKVHVWVQEYEILDDCEVK